MKMFYEISKLLSFHCQCQFGGHSISPHEFCQEYEHYTVRRFVSNRILAKESIIERHVLAKSPLAPLYQRGAAPFLKEGRRNLVLDVDTIMDSLVIGHYRRQYIILER
jgi:hypothetical protein